MGAEGDDLNDQRDGAESTEPAAPAGGDPEPGSVAVSESAAPEADDWKPPTREEWETSRKHAEIGARFAPYADDIDGMFRDRLRGVPSERESSAKTKEPDDLDDLLGEKYSDTLAALNTDGRVWDRIFRGLNKRVNGEEMAGLKKNVDELRGVLRDLQAYNELVAPRRFNESADWKQSGKDYITLLQKGFNDPSEAWRIARDRAAKRGATPAQAAAEGDKAAAKAEATNAAVGEQGGGGVARTAMRGGQAVKRPIPGNDKILDAPGRKPTGSAPEPTRRGRGKNRPGAEAEAMFRAALAQHGIED